MNAQDAENLASQGSFKDHLQIRKGQALSEFDKDFKTADNYQKKMSECDCVISFLLSSDYYPTSPCLQSTSSGRRVLATF